MRYVLEGSVRKAGNRVRMTAQLIDAATNDHLWAERYDREQADIFELPEEITHTVVASIAPQIDRAEIARSAALHDQPPCEATRLARRGSTAPSHAHQLAEYVRFTDKISLLDV